MIKENRAVGHLSGGVDPKKVSREILAALADLRKLGYQATYEQGSDSDELVIRIAFSSVKQTIRIGDGSWRHRGRVRRVVEKELVI